MNIKYLFVGLAMLILNSPLAADRVDGDADHDQSHPAVHSQEELRKLSVALAQKGATTKDYRATKVVLSLARGEFVGAVYLVNEAHGKSQICPIANFSASPEIEAEAAKNSTDSRSALQKVKRQNHGSISYKLSGGLEHGWLDTEGFDSEKHLVFLNSRDLKSGVLVRNASFNADGKVTGYTRYFDLELRSDAHFNCGSKAKNFHDYKFGDEKSRSEDLDEALEHLLGTIRGDDHGKP